MKKIITSTVGMVFEVPVDHPNQPEWGENFIEELIDDSEEIKALKVSQLWSNYNSFAEAQFDSNSRSSLLWINQDPTTTQETKDKIVAIQGWFKQLWDSYKLKKALILTGMEVELSCEEPQVPYTIWELTNDSN
jgi:hypothetical protein